MRPIITVENTYRDKDDLTVLLKTYNKAIDLKPNYADAYNNRGVAYDIKATLTMPLKTTKAIGLKSELCGTYNNRGITYEKEGI